MRMIDTAHLESWLRRDNDLVVVNVLSPEKYCRRHIPGSANVPLSVANFIEEIESKVRDCDAPVVVYCANSECELSHEAADRLERAGFSQVYEYAGGMRAWKEAGHPVQAGLPLF